MNNKDFDNLFNNKLQGVNESDFAFNDAAWESVEGRLKNDGILPPKSRWHRFLPLFLIFGFVISNGLLSWKYYSADKEVTLLGQKIEVLETQLSQSEETLIAANKEENQGFIEKKEAEQLIDTKASSVVPQVKVVEKIVYVPQIVFVNQNDGFSSELVNDSFSDKSQLILNSSTFGQLALGHLYSNDGDYSLKNAYWSNQWGRTLDFKRIGGNDNSDITASDNEGVLNENFEDLLKVDSLDFSKKIAEKNSEIDVFDNAFLEKKEIKTLEYDLDSLADVKEIEGLENPKNGLADYLFVIGEAVSPDGYELGMTINGGLGYSANYFNISRISLGLVGGFRFSDNIRLSIGANWNFSVYALDEIEGGDYSDDMFVDLPNLTPFYPDDRLNKVEGKLQFLEIPIEAEYIFGNAQKAWRPFMGGGVVARYHYQQVFEYYFLQSPDFLIDYNTGYQNRNFKEFGVNTWMAKVGMEYSINSDWLARGALNYANDFRVNGIDQRAFQQFGARLSLMYRF